MYVIRKHDGEIHGIETDLYTAIKETHEHDAPASGEFMDYIQDDDGWYSIRVRSPHEKGKPMVDIANGKSLKAATLDAYRKFSDWNGYTVSTLADELDPRFLDGMEREGVDALLAQISCELKEITAE